MKKEDILDYLRQLKGSLPDHPITEIGLFGSRARQMSQVTSDIDLFVKFDPDYLKNHDVWSYFDVLNEIKRRTEAHFNFPVDIVDKENANTTLRSVIEKEGVSV